LVCQTWNDFKTKQKKSGNKNMGQTDNVAVVIAVAFPVPVVAVLIN